MIHIDFNKLTFVLPEEKLEKGVSYNHPLYEMFQQAAAEVAEAREEEDTATMLKVVLELQLIIAAYEN